MMLEQEASGNDNLEYISSANGRYKVEEHSAPSS
jgi:hypothetical protein